MKMHRYLLDAAHFGPRGRFFIFNQILVCDKDIKYEDRFIKLIKNFFHVFFARILFMYNAVMK